MRRIAFLLAALLSGALLMGGLAQAAPSAGVSAKKVRAVKPTVRILTTSATQLAKGKVKVQVKANKGARVRLTSTTSTFDVPNAKLAKPATAKLGRKRAKVVTMRLTPDAKAGMAGCQLRKLTVVAKNGKRQAKVTKTVVRNQSGCALTPVDVSDAADCNFIARPKSGMCMLPFPDDYYTVADKSSPTGKRLHFTTAAMPKNSENWNSPGSSDS